MMHPPQSRRNNLRKLSLLTEDLKPFLQCYEELAVSCDFKDTSEGSECLPPAFGLLPLLLCSWTWVLEEEP